MRKPIRCVIVLLGATAIAVAAPAGAGAATFQVTSATDPADPTANDGVCDIGGVCTLRSAVNATNTAAGSDTITFAPGLGPSIALAGTNLPAISGDVTIQGPGAASLAVDADNIPAPSRVIRTNNGTTVLVSGLTITGGDGSDTPSARASGIENVGTTTLHDVAVTGNVAVATPPSGTQAFAEGGGIRNFGTLTLIDSTVSGNAAVAITTGDTFSNAEGGGIFNRADAQLTIRRSTISGNTASATTDPGAGFRNANASGAGIRLGLPFTAVAHPTVIDRSTISGNTATANGGASSNPRGGGIFDQSNSPAMTVNPLTIVSSTLTGNQVQAVGTNPTPSGANLLRATGMQSETITNTIVSNPIGAPSCSAEAASGTLTSGGHNIDSANSCGFNAASDRNTLDPMLGPLASNGGPTQTHALLTGSPALDGGVAAPGETIDQRGLPRPSDSGLLANFMGGDGSDVGAFELQVPMHTITTATTGTGTGSVDSTPGGISCGADCSEAFTDGTMVLLVPTPGPNSQFTGWSGACTGTAPCQITVSADVSVTATFASTLRALTVAKAGTGSGTVTSSPAGINCGSDCSEVFPTGSIATLTATPSAGSAFSGWSGAGCSGTGTCQVLLNSDQAATATFTAAPAVDDTVAVPTGKRAAALKKCKKKKKKKKAARAKCKKKAKALPL